MRNALSCVRRGPVFLATALAVTGCTPAGDTTTQEPIIVADVGLQTPESVQHDPVADVYLVSNVNGSPFAKDDNGFLSRIGPSGEVLNLKWIDGAAADVTLNAPKGIALRGDTIFVTDIDVVRLFDRTTGAPAGAWQVPGATFLNALAVGPDGALYVTDSGFNEGFEPSGTDAVYRFDASGTAIAVAQGADLGGPNGILAEARGLTVVTFRTGEVYEMDPTTGARTALDAPQGQFDGVKRLGDGSLLVSSWADSAVYRVDAAGQSTRLITDVESPADIGYDATRGRVLIPIFLANRVEIRPVP